MMTREKRIGLLMHEYMMRGHSDTFGTPRHFIVAADVLDKLGKELHKNKMGYLDDLQWGFHILVPDGRGCFISLHCGGFDKTINVQKLKKNGDVDHRYEERAFRTPRGVVNYLKKHVRN